MTDTNLPENTSISEHDPKLFVHTADLHLAPRSSTITKKDPKTNRLIRDLDMERAFEDAVTETLSQKPLPSAFVIAGDIFDTYRGSSDAFISVVNQIRRLRAAGVHVIAIAGNHDTPTNVTKTPMFSMLKNVFEQGKPQFPLPDDGDGGGIRDAGVTFAYDEIEHVVVGDVEYVLLPHLSCLNGCFTEEDLKCECGVSHRVLVVHGVAAGDPSLHQMDEMKEIPIAKWIMDMDWDYIAFGHYHKPGWIHGYVGKAAYCGSLENTVISGPDVSMSRGPVFVDLSKEGKDLYDMHIRPPRAIVELPDIDVGGADINAEELENLISEVILDANVDGCIVRNTVKNVTRSLYKSMTHRNFQHVNPEMLYIKTNYEFAVDPSQRRTMAKVENGEAENTDDVEISEEALLGSFHPLAREIESAIDRLVENGTIRVEMRESVNDIIASYL